MKTTLFLTALFISTITFAQTSKKGYDYYQNSSTNRASATDYNSSRSNKSEKSGTRATDYNSSRSNKSEKSGTRATGYNSSRSNRRGVNSDATDYNSSRSNRRGISASPDSNGTPSIRKAFVKKPGNNDNPMYKENANKGTNPLYNQ